MGIGVHVQNSHFNWEKEILKTHLFFFLGTIPVPLQLRLEGPVEKPAAGGSDQTLRQPEERSQRHQGPQMVCHNRLDRNLREKGKTPYTFCSDTKHCYSYKKNKLIRYWFVDIDFFFFLLVVKFPAVMLQQYYFIHFLFLRTIHQLSVGFFSTWKSVRSTAGCEPSIPHNILQDDNDNGVLRLIKVDI